MDFFLILGEMSVGYLFTRYRFNWDEVDFSIFSTYSMVTNLIGKFYFKYLLEKFTKYDTKNLHKNLGNIFMKFHPSILF